MQALREHVARLYRHALERTATSLPTAERLRYACPEPAPRQRAVAELLGTGTSNEAIGCSASASRP